MTPTYLLLIEIGLRAQSGSAPWQASLSFPQCEDTALALPVGVALPSHSTPPCQANRLLLPLCPIPGAASSCPRGPDFLSKVTVEAIGAQRPIKPIDAGERAHKTGHPARGCVFCATPTRLREGTRTCKQCGGSVRPPAVHSMCWVREGSNQAGLLPPACRAGSTGSQDSVPPGTLQLCP